MSPMNYQSFQCKVADGVARITLDRPERLNALTFEVYRELTDCFYALRSREDVGVVSLTGAGRAFCSGGDVNDIIGDLVNRDMKEVLDFTRMTGELIANMRELDRPIVAAIGGVAAGAGAVIALASDFRIFAADAKIQFLFVKVGLTGADMGAAFLLPRILGQARATEILMLGEGITAEQALAWGLANRVVPVGDVAATAEDFVQRLLRAPRFAVRMTKRMINAEWTMELDSAIEAEAQAQALMLMGQDHREFLAAWREKRKPEFKGR
ncbi:MAG: enoyl-CoA hydratase family protein [Planctomycetes bacterium]|nr:enoyl-CoA hydratase family protein [Planctomycetota bacterium]